MINIQETSQITKIYLVTNCFGDPNKVYIGKTKNSTRENNHKKKFGYNTIFTYIDEVESLYYKDWEPLETFWIEYFRFLGFELQNIRKKGGSGPNFHTEETKLKISESLKGRDCFWSKGKPNTLNSCLKSEETKQKMRKPKKEGTGLKISESKKGFKHSEESKKKISNTLKNGNHSDYYDEEVRLKISKSKGNKSVLQYNLEGNLIKEWSYLSEATRFNKGDIQACCVGKQKTAGGFIWKYNNK